ncbi:TetR/AcrR family transcriptional regulator [Acinetobacter sp. S40]|nr:TetR/AcrR family transcriptional regulator [Acinetobacter sp. S40]MBK0062457.1 TetR/AcrR family transcriptional regulator [Acinetobacter sp. S55]MBK0066261.1 TetR/AcrR family transcriptional regulator [Acinetobacter sp. S54]
MKNHLMVSALDLYCQVPAEQNLLIDDFVKHAGVSRGTFYNYFTSTNELLTELAIQMSDEILDIIEPIIFQFDHPLERVMLATKLYLRSATRYPVWGQLITSVGPRFTLRGRNISRYLTRDLKKAHDLGLVIIKDYRVSRDIFLGSAYYSLETILTEAVDQDYFNLVIETLFINLGIAPEEAQRLMSLPLPSEVNIQTPFFTVLKNHQIR